MLFLVFVGTSHHPRCYGLYLGLRVVGLGLDVGLRVVGLGLGVGLRVVGLDVDGLPVGADVGAPEGGEVLAAVGLMVLGADFVQS